MVSIFYFEPTEISENPNDSFDFECLRKIGNEPNIRNAGVCRCVGYYGEEDSPSRRLGRPLIFCRTESDCPLENGYARPVEGIHVLVDMRHMQVIEFEDRNFVPLPPPDPLRNYTAASSRGGVDRTDIKPLLITQPEGPSFRVNGYAVEWQKVVPTHHAHFHRFFAAKKSLICHLMSYSMATGNDF